jgi:hypothetical protein
VGWYEFSPGHSVAKDDKYRINEMTKYLYNAYFTADEALLHNKEALNSTIKKLAEKAQAASNNDSADGKEMDLLSITEIYSSNAVLDAIQASMWTSNFLDASKFCKM